MSTTMTTMLFYWIVCVYFLQKQNSLNVFWKLCRPYCAASPIGHELTRTRPTTAALGYNMATKKFFALIAQMFVNDFDPKWSVLNDCDWEWLLLFLLINFLINKKSCQTTMWLITTMKWSVVTLSKRHFWNPRKKIKKLCQRDDNLADVNRRRQFYSGAWTSLTASWWWPWELIIVGKTDHYEGSSKKVCTCIGLHRLGHWTEWVLLEFLRLNKCKQVQTCLDKFEQVWKWFSMLWFVHCQVLYKTTIKKTKLSEN